MRIPIIFLCLTALSVQAELHVTGGHLVVQDSYLVELGSVVVSDSACLKLGETAVLSASSLAIETNGIVKGSGTIDADVTNDGTLLGNGGSSTVLTVTGTTTNNGIVRMVAQTEFSHLGEFNNAGLLDLIMSPSAPPGQLVGAGTVVTGDTLPPLSITVGPQVDLQFTAYPGHRYSVWRSLSLTGANSWIPVGAEFSVNTTELIELSDNDTDPSTNASMFYRYEILD